MKAHQCGIEGCSEPVVWQSPFAGIAVTCSLCVNHKQVLTALLSQEVETALREERTRMAQELHDTLMQGLVGINLQIGTALADLTEAPENARICLVKASSLARESLEETRRAMRGLRPKRLEEADLASALIHLVKTMSSPATPAIEFHLNGTFTPLSSPLEDALFRIAQEALTNALKSAQATKICVQLTVTPQEIAVSVADDGQGFKALSSQVSNGYGLTSMRQRAQRIGGQLVIESEPGKGSQIIATVPLAEQQTKENLARAECL